MTEICRETASLFEKKIAQVYVESTFEALVFEVAVLGMLFYKAGFSSFTLMTAMGISLIILTVVSAVIFFKKKKLKKAMFDALEEKAVSESDFVEFVKENATEFEFVHALMISPARGKNRRTDA